MINSEIKEIINVFNNNFVYEIPDFQRDFVWGAEEVRQLFKDFYEDSGGDFRSDIKDLDGYLLGNIVLIEDKARPFKKIVIDGQQRLTTLSLLYKALETILMEKIQNPDPAVVKRWSKRSSDLAKGYGIINDEDEFESPKISHHESLKFGEAYRSIVKDKIVQSDGPENTSDVKINEVYDVIIEEIRAFDDSQLAKFVTYIKTKVMLIVTTAPSLSKAFQLFEILNNRGKDLEPLDLIKNTLLKNLVANDYSDLEREQFNDDWKQFINNLEITPKRKVESSTFLKHYLIGTIGINMGKDKLFKYFSEQSMDSKEVLDLINNFKRVSNIYGAIEKKNYDNFINDTNKMFILFELLQLRQAHTMLIPFYQASEEMKDAVVDLAIRLGASVLFSYTQTNYIEAEIPSLIRSFHQNKEFNGLEYAFTIFKNEIEKKIADKAKLAKDAVTVRKFENNKGQYNKKGLDLLRFIELYAHHNVHIKSTMKDRRLTLEHIMPRKFEDSADGAAGFESELARKDYLNRIGNLAIIYNTDNSHLSNKLFSEKKDVYIKTDFLTTKSLAGEVRTHIKTGKDAVLYRQVNGHLASYDTMSDYWTKTMIEHRSKQIAAYLEYILVNK